jgi:hypothetical protein
MNNSEKEALARAMIAKAQRQLIEAELLLNDHAAAIHTRNAIRSTEEALVWLEEKVVVV